MTKRTESLCVAVLACVLAVALSMGVAFSPKNANAVATTYNLPTSGSYSQNHLYKTVDDPSFGVYTFFRATPKVGAWGIGAYRISNVFKLDSDSTVTVDVRSTSSSTRNITTTLYRIDEKFYGAFEYAGDGADFLTKFYEYRDSNPELVDYFKGKSNDWDGNKSNDNARKVLSGETIVSSLHGAALFSHSSALAKGNSTPQDDVFTLTDGQNEVLPAGCYFVKLEAGTSSPDAGLYSISVEQAFNSYTVSFNSNGGTPVESQSVKEGETASEPPAPRREDFKFGGWNVSDAAGTDTGVPYTFSEPVTADVYLIATWTPDEREKIIEVEDPHISLTYAQGVNIDGGVLPATLKVKTNLRSEAFEVAVSWGFDAQSVQAGKNSYTAAFPEEYAVGVPDVVAVITVKEAHVQTGYKLEADWDARNETLDATEHPTDGAGNYIIAEGVGFSIKGESTIKTNSTNEKGWKTVHLEQNVKIIINVEFNATIKIRAGANGSGSRTYSLTDASGSSLASKSFNRGTTTTPDVYADDNDLITAEVAAGTYYFQNGSSSSAQLYEVVILNRDLQITTEKYSFEAGEALIPEQNLPAQAEGFTFVGWVSPSGRFVETAAENGEYAPVYAKVNQMVGSVRIEDAGIRFGFSLELINGDAVEKSSELSVTLKISANKTYEFASPVYDYSMGKVTMSAVVVGFGDNTAWNEISVTAEASFTLGGKTFEMSGSATAKEIAQSAVAAHPELANALAQYLA